MPTEIIIALAGVAMIPWVVFVTTSIYALRQQVALMRAEVDLLKRIEALVAQQHALALRQV